MASPSSSASWLILPAMSPSLTVSGPVCIAASMSSVLPCASLPSGSAPWANSSATTSPTPLPRRKEGRRRPHLRNDHLECPHVETLHHPHQQRRPVYISGTQSRAPVEQQSHDIAAPSHRREEEHAAVVVVPLLRARRLHPVLSMASLTTSHAPSCMIRLSNVLPLKSLPPTSTPLSTMRATAFHCGCWARPCGM